MEMTGSLILNARRRAHIEWPTIALAALIYAAFGLLTWFYDLLPWWLVLPLGAYVVAWHGSLQHEVLHGHPTPWRRWNEVLVFPNLWLWMPFRLYRGSHLAHHVYERLTDPLDDPESFYVAPETWAHMGPVVRSLLRAHNTLLGRLLLGPAYCVWRLYAGEVRRAARGDGRNGRVWLLHLGSCAVVVAWVVGVCRVPIVDYLVLFVYPGISLTLLRSYLEHQARADVGQRTALVEAGPVLSLVFLNNNLHALHHAEPGVPWYKLPARYRERRTELLAANGGYLFRGYAEVVARYLLWPKEAPIHPGAAQPCTATVAGVQHSASNPGQTLIGQQVA